MVNTKKVLIKLRESIANASEVKLNLNKQEKIPKSIVGVKVKW